jgi:uncharacterized SAM-binding protein YcdF (DUF218 family)
MIQHLRSIFMTLVFIVWVVGYAYFLMMTGLAIPTDREEKTDAIVVLTGGNFRTYTGLRLLTDGAAPELFITGVHKAVKEADIRALWKEQTPLPECCVTLGQRAETTLENAAEAKQWIEQKKFKRIRLVTSTYHLQRALLEFQYAMPDIVIIPHPVEEEDYSPHELKFWTITLSEYSKYIVRSMILFIMAGR